MEQLSAEYFDKLWEESKPKDGMKHTKETWDELAKNWNIDPPQVREAKDKSVHEIANYLLKKGVLTADSVVADIGCGTGNYSVEFAKHTKKVLASDISSVMLGYCKEAAKDMSNIEYCETDFLSLDLEPWKDKFDLVFTSLTPAMSGLESVEKINYISKGYCFNNSFVYRRDSLRNLLLQNVFNMSVNTLWGNSSPYCLFNILWQLGYLPEMTYYKEEIAFDYELTDDFAKNCAENIIRNRAPSSEEISRVYDYLQTIAVDGRVFKETESLFAWTLWKA